MAKLTLEEEALMIEKRLEELENSDYKNLSIKEQKTYISLCKLLDKYLTKHSSKVISGRKKNPQLYVEKTEFREQNRILENLAVFLTDFYFITFSGKKSYPAAKYAKIGSALNNPHCLLALSYMYSKGLCGIFPQAKKARELLELGARFGGTEDDNFELAQSAVWESEQRVRGFKNAAAADYSNGVSGGFIDTIACLSNLISDMPLNTLPKEIEGEVVSEHTTTGEQYMFYAKDDTGHTYGQRLKTYDSFSGKGETESGEKITKK